MAGIKDSNTRLLFKAVSQGGLFTAKQAVECGIATKNHNRYVSRGEWVRVRWGVYCLSEELLDMARDARLIDQPRTDILEVFLWSRNKAGDAQAVVSHVSAASLHELGDLNPGILEVTVPTGFKKPVPENLQGRVALHYGDLEEGADWMLHPREGYCITTPLRTILDLIRLREHTHPQLKEAYQEARRRGKITLMDVESRRGGMSEDESALLQSWEEGR